MPSKARINKHKSTIRTHRNYLPVPKHFYEKGHELGDLKFWIIDQVPRARRGGDHRIKLKRKELEWIHRLDTLSPQGLNLEFKVLLNML